MKKYPALDPYSLVDRRRRMPETRAGITHKFTIEGKHGRVKGYIFVGLFEDGKPGELFINLDKRDDRVWANALSILTSLALQSGIPLEKIIDKMQFQNGEPSGFTKHPQIRVAKSIVDYVFRWMGYQFIPNFGEEKKK